MDIFRKLISFIKGSFAPSIEGEEQGEERRIFYRYQIPRNFPLSVKILESHLIDRPSPHINDIGWGGISMEWHNEQISSAIPQVLPINITFGEKTVSLSGQVVRWDRKKIVLQFKPEEGAKLQLIATLFPKLLGLSLKECPLKQQKEIAPFRWFHGQCYTDLFVWHNHQQSEFPISHFLFLYENSVIEWQLSQKKRTGVVVRETFFSASFNFSPTPPNILYHDHLSEEMIAGAIEIIENSIIPSEIKDSILQMLGPKPKEFRTTEFGKILREKRKWPRYFFLPEERFYPLFSVPELSAQIFPKNEENIPFKVVNLSHGGVGISLDNSKNNIPPIGSEILVTLLWQGKQIPQKGQIVSFLQKEKILGIEFLEISSATTQVLNEILNPKQLGVSLKEIFMRPSSESPFLRWFHGISATDLFCWESANGKIIKYQFIMESDFLEWNTEEGIRTADVLRNDFVMIRFSYPMTEPNMIQYHSQISPLVIQRCNAVLSISKIDTITKDFVLQTLWNE